MYTIREFSRISGLSVKALRIYHERGILLPHQVDRKTGYRYYSRANIQKADVVRSLREMDFSLEAIESIMDDACDKDSIFDSLEQHKQRMQNQMEKAGQIVQALDTIIQAEKEAQKIMEQTNYPVEEKVIADQLIASIRFKGKYEDCGERFQTIFRAMGWNSAGTPFNLYYDPEYKEEDADIESCVPIKKEKIVDGIDIKTLTGGKFITVIHKGPYSQLGHSYEKILDYVKRKGVTFSVPSREIYIKGPGMIFKGNPHKYLTEIQLKIDD